MNGDAHQAAVAVVAEFAADVDKGRLEDLAVTVDLDRAVLAGDQDGAVGAEGKGGGGAEILGEDVLGEAVGEGEGMKVGGESGARQQGEQEDEQDEGWADAHRWRDLWPWLSVARWVLSMVRLYH